MNAEAHAFLYKAQQNLEAASADFDAGRFDACAGRAYYACFQAAVAALLVESIRPAGTTGQWSHEFVQAQFAGILVARRKRYTPELRHTLVHNLAIRERADYKTESVSPEAANRSLRRARAFVRAVKERLE